MNIESVIARVKALRALASDCSNLHEAQQAAAKADELIQRHRLEEADLESAGTATSEAVGDDGEPLDSWTRSISWKLFLAAKLSKHYGCFVSSCRRTCGGYTEGVSINIAGRPSDVHIVRYMYAWLGVEIERLASAERGKGARNDFRIGACTGIGNTLAKSRQAAEQIHAQSHGNAAAIVIADRYAAAELWAKTYHGKIGDAHAVKFKNEDALRRGIVAGENINLGSALPGSVVARSLPERTL